MQRRQLLAALGAGSVAATGRAAAARATTRSVTTRAGEIDPLAFDSTCSLLDANGDPVVGEPEYVVATAEENAFNEDADGETGAFVDYPDDESIPLVASADGVIGIGAVFLQDGTGFQNAGNEEFVLNVLDAETGGSGTVLWDEGHGQFFTTDRHLAFTGYAENDGYDVVGTETLAADLATDPAAAVVTTPPASFTADELDAVANYVDRGGTLVLFSQSDFGGFNQSPNLNEILARVDAPFRFNEDQVNDFVDNAGIFFVPATDEFDRSFPYFADRPGLAPPEFERGRRYTVDVIDVADGDTVDVQFQNGFIDEVRLLGIDTPETFLPAELVAEWEGIDDEDFLAERGEVASQFAFEELFGEEVEVFFDREEPFRGGFGRLLMFLAYDADGDGAIDTNYNRRVIREGYGRVFDSGFAKHDAFVALEREAKARGVGVWSESDVDATPPLAGRPERVEEIFVPKAVPVEVTDAGGGRGNGRGGGNGRAGNASDVEILARASETATQPNAPLAAVDDAAGVAVVGGQVIDEDYDEPDTPVSDPTAFDDFQFAAGLAERLTQSAGEYLIDGGRGQFDEEEAVGAEDAAFFGRYLEGLDTTLTQYNDLSTGDLSRGRVLFVSNPAESFSVAELDAIDRFRRGPGAVIVLADRTGDRAVTNEFLAALDTPLRVASGVVDDPETNAGESFLPVATDVPVVAPAYDDDEGNDATAPNGNGRGADGRSTRGDDRRRARLQQGRAPTPGVLRGRRGTFD